MRRRRNRYVELFMPAYPDRRRFAYRVHLARDFEDLRERLSSGCVAVFEVVGAASTGAEAVGAVLYGLATRVGQGAFMEGVEVARSSLTVRRVL